MVRLAEAAAREAGDYALSRLGKVSADIKSAGQLVTEADNAAQDMIVRRIAERYDGHGILAEEGPDDQLLHKAPRDGADIWWVIDPIDGTRNFAYGLPTFAVSIGLMQGGRPVAGVIYAPSTNMLLSAQVGGPAYHNGVETHCHPGPVTAESLVALPCRYVDGVPACVMEIMRRHIPTVLGSAALQYSYVAMGGCVGTCSWNLRLWDIAAGTAIVEAAGGRVTAIDGSVLFPLDCSAYQGEPLAALAAGPEAHAYLAGILNGTAD